MNQVRAFGAMWERMALRERRLVLLALLLVVVALSWTLALAPALRVLRTAPAQLQALDAQLESMQGMAVQARGMQARTPLAREETVRILESSVRQNLGDGATLRLTGDRATVTLKAVPPQSLARWLVQVRASARAMVSQASLARGPTGWDGSLVLDLPAPP